MENLVKITANGIDFKINNPVKVTWDSNSNMNDFKEAGVYEIYGERTRQDDNLPILNASSGHSIAARLTVVASTLQPNNTEICVTQFLQLSNRIGGEGNMYVRTYNENNNSMNGWSPWQKQMGMVETLINSNDATVGQEIFSNAASKIGDGLNSMIDNGMYSGIYIDNLTYTGTNSLYYLSAQPTFVETFVLVVINDYAASGKLNLPRHITQLKYAVDAITGQSTVKKRVGTSNDTISWSDWTDISGESQKVDFIRIPSVHALWEYIKQKVYNVNIGDIININACFNPVPYMGPAGIIEVIGAENNGYLKGTVIKNSDIEVEADLTLSSVNGKFNLMGNIDLEKYTSSNYYTAYSCSSDNSNPYYKDHNILVETNCNSYKISYEGYTSLNKIIWPGTYKFIDDANKNCHVWISNYSEASEEAVNTYNILFNTPDNTEFHFIASWDVTVTLIDANTDKFMYTYKVIATDTSTNTTVVKNGYQITGSEPVWC